jgi:hypothetical protein
MGQIPSGGTENHHQKTPVMVDHEKEPSMFGDEEDHFVDPYALTDDELAEIAAGCKIFPGEWFVEPVLDHRRPGAPRVWVRPAAGNDAFRLSFGFSKEDNLLYVAIQIHDNSGDFPTQGLSFGTLRDALAMCQGSLKIVTRHMGRP